MRVAFRKHHRLIAITVCIPLMITAITGIAITFTDQWFHQNDLTGFLLQIHTFQIFGLSAFLPIFNGLGLIGLILTGLSMTGLFSQRRKPKQRSELP
ncbi:peptidase [Aetokthonos hydrillicola Thurmond2011]|jgi:uncharacterized membrane protein affecting hemolysin expression|uniref:Peptidase n=1 Tax=Aetokthonos hydrillicola Thurmond2011 TaxID=2712845 RepID=A0AAP5M9X9_9CYAN|nr:peptidase [Aetokthonos hydrillicola]MBO3461092.1 peptidase [Aetokthonos hydrillicola CCALA 1050]MBW4590687.1 peptidase [Aetokthonos hydrillicola CCALA 1050]MDR9897665.1 peptidase [Aetokthonos hydrillicola Thurmond2011]